MYALANNLRGFASSTLRVRVTRTDATSGNVWVTTADLLDAGTALVVTRAQVTALEGTCPDCLGQGSTVHWGAVASVTRPCSTCRASGNGPAAAGADAGVVVHVDGLVRIG